MTSRFRGVAPPKDLALLRKPHPQKATEQKTSCFKEAAPTKGNRSKDIVI